MVTGASNADVAVILIDARKGVLEQTKRHSFLASLVGIKNIILAVNKMDLINYDQSIYKLIIKEYQLFVEDLGFDNVFNVPVSALNGDNILKSTTFPSQFRNNS